MWKWEIILEIAGKRKTAAKVMPCYAGERGKSIIQMDGISRENAQIGLDEKLEITKVESKPASKITLSPLIIPGLFTPLDRNLSKQSMVVRRKIFKESDPPSTCAEKFLFFPE